MNGTKKSTPQKKGMVEIAFDTAALVFDDPDVMFRKDRIVEGEQRWNGEEIIRIISAREANSRERRVYIRQAGS